MPVFEVPIVYRGQVNYLVEAASPEEAAARARERYAAGESGDALGNEWEEIDRVGNVIEVAMTWDELGRWLVANVPPEGYTLPELFSLAPRAGSAAERMFAVSNAVLEIRYERASDGAPVPIGEIAQRLRAGLTDPAGVMEWARGIRVIWRARTRPAP